MQVSIIFVNDTKMNQFESHKCTNTPSVPYFTPSTAKINEDQGHNITSVVTYWNVLEIEHFSWDSSVVILFPDCVYIVVIEVQAVLLNEAKMYYG